MSRDGVYLDVPYPEKDQAKKLGARWDPEARRWYVPAGKAVGAFSRWMPAEGEASGGGVTIWAPLYVAEGRAPCWKCQRPTPVYALAASAVEDEGLGKRREVPLLTSVQALPAEIAAFMSQHYPSYRVAYSSTAGGRYYMNHCRHCGTKAGDFFLHEEPDGAFFPTSPEDARAVTLWLIPLSLDRGLVVQASAGVVEPNLIHLYAKRA